MVCTPKGTLTLETEEETTQDLHLPFVSPCTHVSEATWENLFSIKQEVSKCAGVAPGHASPCGPHYKDALPC